LDGRQPGVETGKFILAMRYCDGITSKWGTNVFYLAETG